MTAVLYLIAIVAAVVDWWAVSRRYFRIEYFFKPATLVFLLAAAARTDLPDVKPWVLTALALSLVGDVALLLVRPTATDEPDPAFLAGLGAFLLAHIAYLVAFLRHGLHGGHLIIGIVIVVVIAGATLPRVVTRAARTDGLVLAVPVCCYAAALGLMTVFAVGTTGLLIGAGGVLFLVSDTVLAWERFVRPLRRGPVTVIVTYHLAQLLILIGLATT